MPTDDAPAAAKDQTSLDQAVRFLETLFEPGNIVLFRPIESWTEAGRRMSKVDFQGIEYRPMGLRSADGTWGSCAESQRILLLGQTRRSAALKTNSYFGVCPRFEQGRGDRSYDLAWQIRVARALWADIDHVTTDEALQRCEKAGLPRPSILVNSGNGAHVYWLLSEPYKIDDVGEPEPVFTEFIDQGPGKKKKGQQYRLDGEEKLYLNIPCNVPSLSAKAQTLQDILRGVAAKIGADHTFDLTRLLRIPGTLNRKDERNGHQPVPCQLVECDAGRRYPIEQFAQFIEASPDKAHREQVAKVKLPTRRKLSPKCRDKFHDLLLVCAQTPTGDRSEADFGLCCWAIEHGMACDEVWAEAENVGKFAEKGRTYFDLTWANAEKRTREKILEKAQRRAGHSASTKEAKSECRGGDRPIIVADTEESRVVDQAIAALGSQQDLFQRGGLLVHVIRELEPPSDIVRPKDAPRIAAVKLPRLRELLASAAEWQLPSSEGEPQPIHPPDWVVKAVEARGQWIGIRRLEGVVESPVLRADGSILEKPGYDPMSGLLYESQTAFPPVPENPTHGEVQSAVDALLEVVADFPFAQPEHRSACLAGVLTPLSRRAFVGPSPLFLIDSNVRGSGKTLLTDAISIVTSGRRMARMTWPRDDDELRKRITALAVAAEWLILIDNIVGAFGSASLDAVLTATTWTDRVLGKSEVVARIPLTAVWYATGNNVILEADTVRRVLHIRLETLEENPEERSDFQHPDLLGWVRRERPRLAVAALTILRGYVAAGRPDMGLSPWGSFEGWSDLVRQALVWAGQPDPGATRTELRKQSDCTACALAQLLIGWQEADSNGSGMTVSEALRLLNEHPREYETLRAALYALVPAKDGKLSPRSIGMKLHHLRRRVVGGRFIDSRPSPHGAVWRVSEVKEAGTTGTKGTTHNPARAEKSERRRKRAHAKGPGIVPLVHLVPHRHRANRHGPLLMRKRMPNSCHIDEAILLVEPESGALAGPPLHRVGVPAAPLRRRVWRQSEAPRLLVGNRRLRGSRAAKAPPRCRFPVWAIGAPPTECAMVAPKPPPAPVILPRLMSRLRRMTLGLDPPPRGTGPASGQIWHVRGHVQRTILRALEVEGP